MAEAVQRSPATLHGPPLVFHCELLIHKLYDYSSPQTSIQVKETKSCKRCSAWAAFPAWRRLGDKDNRGEDNDDVVDDDLDNDDEDDDDQDNMMMMMMMIDI